LKTLFDQSGVAAKPYLPWLAAAAVAAVAFWPAKDYLNREIMPFGIAVPPLDGKQAVATRTPITVEALGFGAHLASVKLTDASGKVLAEVADKNSVTLTEPLAFGVRHTLKVSVERPWFGQTQSKEISFTTESIPVLEGTTERSIAADGSVSLRFNQPVGEVKVSSQLPVKAEPDATRQTIRLVASGYGQSQKYPVELDWKTSNGTPLPPLHLELTTPPPFTVESNMDGQTNLGVALPLKLNFSEALVDRANASQFIKIKAADGTPITGKWEWQGPQKMQFKPQPNWPAASTIEVYIDTQGLKSGRGGSLEKPFSTRFTTGSDRKIFVYLDRQRVEAVENGEVVKTFKVSTGKAKTPTVTGSFYIYDRYVHKTMRSDVPRGHRGYYEVENVPYTQFFHADYAFHGAFWHNSFGRPASHGCVNMATRDHNPRWPNSPEDAGWLYHWASLGVPVTVMRSAPAVTTAAATPNTSSDTNTASTTPSASPAANPVLNPEKVRLVDVTKPAPQKPTASSKSSPKPVGVKAPPAHTLADAAATPVAKPKPHIRATTVVKASATSMEPLFEKETTTSEAPASEP
jgi:lipoprotein-anchoring transpeptidase ErfK/SrfK